MLINVIVIFVFVFIYLFQVVHKGKWLSLNQITYQDPKGKQRWAFYTLPKVLIFPSQWSQLHSDPVDAESLFVLSTTDFDFAAESVINLPKNVHHLGTKSLRCMYVFLWNTPTAGFPNSTNSCCQSALQNVWTPHHEGIITHVDSSLYSLSSCINLGIQVAWIQNPSIECVEMRRLKWILKNILHRYIIIIYYLFNFFTIFKFQPMGVCGKDN